MAKALKNYYKVLQVDPEAEQEVIEVAYRRLARKYHPDVSIFTDSTQRMQELNEAYSTLRNPERRAQYDNILHRLIDRRGPIQPSESRRQTRRRHATGRSPVQPPSGAPGPHTSSARSATASSRASHSSHNTSQQAVEATPDADVGTDLVVVVVLIMMTLLVCPPFFYFLFFVASTQ